MNIKVMTFNLRIRTPNDGINIFENRRSRIIEAIREQAPDIIGFQEAKDEMKDFLRNALSDEYYIVGCGRESNYHGEATPIAYKKDKFELVGLDTFWLSDTPYVSGSKYENVGQCCTRIAVSAVLSPIGCDNITFVNTHLDVSSEQARIWGMESIKKRLSFCKGKFVLTGDMNDRPNSKCISISMSIEGVTEATSKITHSYHEYGKIKEDFKIDYIFTNSNVVSSHAVPDEPVDGVYISDHYPLCAEIEI